MLIWDAFKESKEHPSSIVIFTDQLKGKKVMNKILGNWQSKHTERRCAFLLRVNGTRLLHITEEAFILWLKWPLVFLFLRYTSMSCFLFLVFKRLILVTWDFCEKMQVGQDILNLNISALTLPKSFFLTLQHWQATAN